MTYSNVYPDSPLRFGTWLAAAFCGVGSPAAWWPWPWPGWPWATSAGWTWHGHRLLVAHAPSGGVFRRAWAVHNVRLGPCPLPSMTLKWPTPGKKQKSWIHKSSPLRRYCMQNIHASLWRMKETNQKCDLWQHWQQSSTKLKQTCDNRQLSLLRLYAGSHLSTLVSQWLFEAVTFNR